MVMIISKRMIYLNIKFKSLKLLAEESNFEWPLSGRFSLNW